MGTLIFKIFGILFRTVGFLILTGAIASLLADMQKLAFNSKRHGLTSMLSINQQLVGKTR